MAVTHHELGRGLRTLLTLAITLPLVGLLGTLAGAIHAFRALVPSLVSLALGLVSFWSYAYLQNRLERRRTQPLLQ